VQGNRAMACVTLLQLETSCDVDKLLLKPVRSQAVHCNTIVCVKVPQFSV